MTGRQSGSRWRFLVQVVPALLYVGAVFAAGTSPEAPDIPLDFSQRDKVLHCVVFGGMSILVWRALRFGWPAARVGRQQLVAGGISALLGALLEVWQSFVPGRSMELLDWLADTLGIALATAAAYMLAGRSPASPGEGFIDRSARTIRARATSADDADPVSESAGQGTAGPAARPP
jgi:peptidoglycan/LPS O-acetylase OafA/YrhL